MMFEVSKMETIKSKPKAENAYEFVLNHAVSVADVKEQIANEAILFVMSGEVFNGDG